MDYNTFNNILPQKFVGECLRMSSGRQLIC